MGSQGHILTGLDPHTQILENVEHCGGERERVRMWQRMAFAKRSMKVTEMEAEKTTMVLVATSTIH